MSRTTLSLNTQRRIMARIAENLPDDLPEEDALRWVNDCAELKKGLRGLLMPEINWLDQLVQAENDIYSAFLVRGQAIDFSQFKATLKSHGEEHISRWIQLGLEPHFLPKRQFRQDEKLRGWKVKPKKWFWQQMAACTIKRRNVAGELVTVTEAGFDGDTVLIDTRCKPAYDNGRQMFADDEAFLGGLIEDLRSRCEIARYDSGQQDSRFGVSSLEWDEQIRPALEARPEFKGVSFRLELAIEANTIPQIYGRMPRHKDGQTDTWVWYEEFFEGASCCLRGGGSGRGGLAGVGWREVRSHWDGGAVRPLGVVATLPLGS